MTTLVQSGARGHSALFSIVAAVVIGATLVLSVGFASAETIHDAAHDVRHATGFPCH